MSPLHPILILAGALAALGAVCYIHHLLHGRHTEKDADKSPAPGTMETAPAPTADEQPDGCCGQHEVCQKIRDVALAGNQDDDYFDDEELDRYAGRPEDDYTDVEIEEFRDIMLTLRPGEVLLWHSALERRSIRLPQPLRDELLILAR